MPPGRRRTPAAETEAERTARETAERERETARRAAELQSAKQEQLLHIQNLISQKEDEIKALDWQIKHKHGIIKGETGEERMKRFDRFARGTRRTWDFVFSPIQWIKGVLLRGGGGKKDKLPAMMKARFPKLRDIERKKAEAQQLIARLNALRSAVERDPASWVRKLNGKQITKILEKEGF